MYRRGGARETVGQVLRIVLMAVIISVGILGLGHVLSQGSGINTPRFGGVYECGFPALGGGRRPAPLLFFLIAILFLLFDIELLALMPGAIRSPGPLCRVCLVGFFRALTWGFWVEWRQGALHYVLFCWATGKISGAYC